MLYPGVVLRSNGMVVMPRVPRPKLDLNRLTMMTTMPPLRSSRSTPTAKRK